MREHDLPIPAAIRKDYDTLHEYAVMAATCCPDFLRRKRFSKQCPDKTKPTMKIWGRDRWAAFDSLPKDLRDEINNEPKNVDQALESALALWQEIESNAEKAMDRILKYESAMDGVDSLPDWLKGESNQAIEIIRELRAERLDFLRKQLEEAEQRKRDQEALAKKQKPIKRYIPATRMEDWRIKEDGELKRLESIKGEVELLRLPPHLAREAMLKKLELVKVTYTRPAGFYTYDPVKAADKADKEPPLKFHPQMYSRGKNF